MAAPAAGQPVKGPAASFSSADFPWVGTSGSLLPPPSGLGPVTYDKANPVMRSAPNNRGDVVEAPLALADLSNPNLKPGVVDHLRKANEEMLAGKKLRYSSRASCKPAGVPEFLVYAGAFQPIHFIQAHDKIVLINQGDVQVRHIYLNVPHSRNPKPSWYGESVGRYEGDELVVDTIGFNDKTFVDDTYNLPHTSQLHVIERFKVIEDGKTLEVRVTVEDPGAFNAPWSAIARYRRATAPQKLTEQPCAENNLDLGNNYNTPTADKPDF
jgi:hypothetical protein